MQRIKYLFKIHLPYDGSSLLTELHIQELHVSHQSLVHTNMHRIVI